MPIDRSLPAPGVDQIAGAILVLRGHKILLDSELAALYGVTTARLNQQVRRNKQRFPADFMFQVTADENANLMLQTATSKARRGGRRTLPLAFTEHGAIMAASVLNTRVAIEMSVFIVRAFGHLRQLVASSAALAKRLDALELRVAKRLGTQDDVIAGILRALRELATPPSRRQRRIGFTARLDDQ